jgi:hypothetical protein
MGRLGCVGELIIGIFLVHEGLAAPLSPRHAKIPQHYLRHVEPSDLMHDAEVDKVFAADRGDFANGKADVKRILHNDDLQAILPSSSDVHVASWAAPETHQKAGASDGGIGDFWVRHDPWKNLPTLKHTQRSSASHASEIQDIFGGEASPVTKPSSAVTRPSSAHAVKPAAPLMSLAEQDSRVGLSGLQHAFNALRSGADSTPAAVQKRLKSDASALEALHKMSAEFKLDAKKQASLLTKRFGDMAKKIQGRISTLSSAKPQVKAPKQKPSEKHHAPGGKKQMKAMMTSAQKHNFEQAQRLAKEAGFCKGTACTARELTQWYQKTHAQKAQKAKDTSKTKVHAPTSGLHVESKYLKWMAKQEDQHAMHVRTTDDITAAAHNPYADLKAPQASDSLYSPSKPIELRAPSPLHHSDVSSILHGVDDTAKLENKAPVAQLAQKTSLHTTLALHTPEKVQSNKEIESHEKQTQEIFGFSREDEHDHRRLHYKSPY